MNSDCTELFGRAWKIISDRQTWEQRQRRFYLMRLDGIRRRNKPFPSAADLHLKLIDQKINQKKAFTIAQILGQPTLSTFACLKPQLADLTMAAQQFHDFELKHRSNLIRTLQTMVDTMWLRGRGIIKAYVDPFDDYRIIHENVDPLYLLMPDDVNGFEDAYEWVHVRQMNVAKFKQDRRYCQEYWTDEGEIEKGTLNKLCGGKDAAERLRTQPGVPGLELIEQDKELKEGYTHSNNSDTIIIWEHYVRTMSGVTVYYYSPVALDVKIRRPHSIPYKVNGRVSAPFFSFQAEVINDGWYAPRGVAEKIADLEIYGCKLWNAKADAMTFLSTPMFEAQVGVQNPANYRLAPGEVLPPGVKPTTFGAPPFDFDQELAFTRGEAELEAATPDTSIEKPNQRGQEKRTKYEVSVAQQISQINMTNEGVTMKDDLGKLYAHDWGLMLQYKRKELSYFVSDDLKTLPDNALHGDYLIMAGGATDDWDRNKRLQMAAQRYETLQGKPNVDQDELLSEYLSADDARLVKKLVVPQQVRTGTEAADENTIINDIAPGPNRPSFPVPVLPDQDHFVRAKVILAWLDAAGKMGTPVSPVEKQRVYQRLAQHVQLLKKMNPQQYKLLEQQIKQLEATPIKRLNQPLVPPLPAQPRRGMRRNRMPAMQNNGFRML